MCQLQRQNEHTGYKLVRRRRDDTFCHQPPTHTLQKITMTDTGLASTVADCHWERTHRPSVVKDILIHYLIGPHETPQNKLIQNQEARREKRGHTVSKRERH